MADIYRTLLDLRERAVPAALCTVIQISGSVPGSEALKMVVTDAGRVAGTVGGGCVEAEVIDAAREVLRVETPRQVEFTLTEEETGTEGLICGGTIRIFIEPLVAPTCYLFGCGHISRSVSRVASLAGFRVVAIDDRAAFASRQRFPEAGEVLCGPFDEVADGLSVGRNGYIVIVTRGHQYDREVLRWAVGTSARYVGMIGSRRKVLTTFRALVAEDGIDPARLAEVRAPVGLDIGAVTQEEIAVAIVAEMIEERRRHYRPARSGPRRPYPLLIDEIEVTSP